MKRLCAGLLLLPLMGCDQAVVTTGGGTNSPPAAVAPIADVITHSSQIAAGQQAADKLRSIQADQQKDLKIAEEMGQ
jgi:hypothetical protein